MANSQCDTRWGVDGGGSSQHQLTSDSGLIHERADGFDFKISWKFKFAFPGRSIVYLQRVFLEIAIDLSCNPFRYFLCKSYNNPGCATFIGAFLGGRDQAKSLKCHLSI